MQCDRVAEDYSNAVERSLAMSGEDFTCFAESTARFPRISITLAHCEKITFSHGTVAPADRPSASGRSRAWSRNDAVCDCMAELLRLDGQYSFVAERHG